MAALVKVLVDLLIRAPLQLLTALLRLLLFLLFLPLLPLSRLWECLSWLFRTKTLYPSEEEEEECGRIPEPLVRRPDPCIYSQAYLASQGLPVTWDNPDIWVAPASNPGAIEPDSYHLHANTDYIVSVRVHNASTDPAIGVRVRLVYRPWSFNSPDLVPVETDASGHEVFRFVNVAPMDSTVTQFKWHTPKVDPGQEQHFCIQAHLFHPMDINPANNIGQENTNVFGPTHAPAPGAPRTIEIPLFNHGAQARDIRFRWNGYEINREDKAELRLQVTEAKVQMRWGDRLFHSLPTWSPVPDRPSGGRPAASRSQKGERPLIFERLTFSTPKSGFRSAKTKYVGFEDLRRQILSRDYSLPEGTVKIVSGAETLRLAPHAAKTEKFEVQVPADGKRMAVNLIAETTAGLMIGGVTLAFNLKT